MYNDCREYSHSPKITVGQIRKDVEDMVVKYNLGYKKENDIGAVLRLLNASAYDFYTGRCEFDDPDYVMSIKSVILRMMNAIERTINGVFNCDLNYPNAIRIEKLKEIFPVGCEVFHISSQKDVRTFCMVMTSVRNINAHAFISSEDERFLKSQFKSLDRIEKLCLKTRYNTDDRITLAGMIALILLFLREPAIKQASRLTNLVSMVAGGGPRKCDGSAYVNTVSHTNFELPIREKAGKTLYDAVLGEHKDLVKGDTLSFGYSDAPSYNVHFKFDGNHITVFENSITKVYYPKDYTIRVVDEEGFVEIANQFPPFVFVDLLYKLDISVFGKAEYKKIKNNIEFYTKLNYPKFYCDKNIDILVMSSDIADYRVVSGSIADAVNAICLRLENNIASKYGVDISKKEYSSFHELLKVTDITPSRRNELSLLRNASMHGLILGEACFYDDLVYVYDFKSAISTLKHILIDLKNAQSVLFEQFQEDVYVNVVNKLVGLRYNVAVDYTKNYLEGNEVEDPNSERVKNVFIFPEASSYDITMLKKLYVNRDVEPLVIKYIYPKEQYPFYIWNNEYSLDLINHYIKEHKLKEVGTVDQGVLKIVHLG